MKIDVKPPLFVIFSFSGSFPITPCLGVISCDTVPLIRTDQCKYVRYRQQRQMQLTYCSTVYGCYTYPYYIFFLQFVLVVNNWQDKRCISFYVLQYSKMPRRGKIEYCTVEYRCTVLQVKNTAGYESTNDLELHYCNRSF